MTTLRGLVCTLHQMWSEFTAVLKKAKDGAKRMFLAVGKKLKAVGKAIIGGAKKLGAKLGFGKKKKDKVR